MPLKFSIPEKVMVNLTVFNILGEKVKELKNELMKPGNYDVEFTVTTLSSGIYFYRLQTGHFVQTNKMILLR